MNLLSMVKSVLVWFKNIFVTREDATAMLSGEEFKISFLVNFFSGTFHELCESARYERRPILIVLLRDAQDEAILQTLQALSGNQDQLNTQYSVFGLYTDIL